MRRILVALAIAAVIAVGVSAPSASAQWVDPSAGMGYPGAGMAYPGAGYGAALEGVTALLAMLASCAAGLTVVGIDNGFGAACAVARMLPD